ncbi:uncharacterized protein LOC117223682 isoform X1 [Megalopta genalis]|uniref:uncharacterized protein LOC117223682 isoform X1 n=2 Tax=Megalopta genalis TaxID=115081 RepID=UPI003FD6969C
MSVIEVLLLAVQFYVVSGRLAVLRRNENDPIRSWNKRKLICVSDDDGAALTWNLDLSARTLSSDTSNAFRNPNESPEKNFVDCKLNVMKDCTTSWTITDWNLTYSDKTLMGPVFDSRWEGFYEYDAKDSNGYRQIRKLNGKEAFAVSIRGPKDVYLLICASNQHLKDSCYWIVIGGWSNKKSAIRKCAKGVPEPSKYSKDSTCNALRSSHDHRPLNPLEWKTFVMTWDQSTKNITVYDSNRMILTFEDAEYQSDAKNNDFILFLWGASETLIRLHSYNFLHTTANNAELVSPELAITTSNFCMEMAVGLCADCRLDLSLVNTSTGAIQQELELITGAASVHGLPTWQYVRVNKTFSSDHSSVKLKMFTSLRQKSQNPLWAVANVRSCPPAGSIRMESIKGSVDTSAYPYVWQSSSCQKLFYNEHTVVYTLDSVEADLDFDDLDCPSDKVGPHCSISCTNELELDESCKDVIVCGEEGCACNHGIIGSRCEKTCDEEHYGRNCDHTCGSCKGSCSFRTGECAKGCDNSMGYKIPPFCQTGIDPPPSPKIHFLNSTAVGVSIPLKKEYQQVHFDFQLQEERNVDQYIDVNAQASNNGTNLTGSSGALHAGYSYRIRVNLSPSDFPIILGEWENFTTPCDPSRSFEVESKSTSLILKWKERTPISCPAGWYNFTLEDSRAGDEIYDGSLGSLPHEFLDLKPYTSYLIKITGEQKKQRIEYFRQEVVTLEAAPSQVRNINSKVTPDIVILTWDPPLTYNGVLREYKVNVETVKYIGCNDLGITPPTKNVTLFATDNAVPVYDLPPYAVHVAKISACTTSCGSEQEHQFKTNEAEKPTETFDDVSMKGFVLKWNRPRDCTTITGNLAARVILKGISEAVANWSITENTSNDSNTTNSYVLDLTGKLYGAETYEARIYVIRKKSGQHNEDAYRKINFTTPAKAPPPVQMLEAYEINELTKNDPPSTQFNIRWKQPKPPLNGKLQYYIVKFYNGRTDINATARCPLWPHFICATINVSEIQAEIQVSAVNEGVKEESDAKTLLVDYDVVRPTAPKVYRLEALRHGVVLATWSHPWLTVQRLRQFVLSVRRTSTRLRTSTQLASFESEYPVKEYEIQYNHRLNLMPSSVYEITIFAETIQGTIGMEKLDSVETPSAIEFESEPTVQIRNESSIVLLQIPAVLNDTRDSTINVVVLRNDTNSRVCNDNAEAARIFCEKTRIKCYGPVWWAASFPSDKFAGKQTFTVGGEKYRDDAINCSLQQGESYVIEVSLNTKFSGDDIIFAKPVPVQMPGASKGFDMGWLIPIFVSLIFTIAVFYLYRRKPATDVIEQDEMCLTTNTASLKKKEPIKSDPIVTTTCFTPAEPSPKSVTSVYGDSVVLVNSEDTNQKENNSSSLVKVKDFEDYVKQAIESGLLDNQYNPLPRGQTKPWDYGKLPQNKPKNRYGNLIAYDENRVVLEKLPDDPYSDYINANYINGYKKANCYIATQGPKPITVNDFWRMIWQEESLIICMLTNVIESEKTKCEQYWPEIGKKKKYGELVVFNAKHTVYADYTFRTLHLTRGQETRKIKHLHYTAWPDHGVPLSTHSVVSYMKKLLATSPGNGPAVIHCSAGVGRTGTIILCDICLRRAAAEGVVDVFAETVALRNQRANMVDTKQQYLLAHLTLLECLLSISTSLACDQSLPMKIDELKKGLDIQQKSLEKAIWQDEALRPAASKITLSERNLAKNRYSELASEKMGRVYLKRNPATDEDSDYISAVFVDGVKMRDQYIATQLPLPDTLGDFWRMVAEYKIELIVSLQPPDPEDPTCCPLVPSPDFTPVPYINIKTKKTIASNYYSSQKLTLVDNTLKPVTEQQVTIVSSTEWKAGRYQEPPSTIALMTMWQATETIARGDGPTAILCHDATTGCGLYLALSVLLERMAVERECDVCLAIRSVRRSNHGFVQSLEQMEYLYDAAITFLKYFETYANFT